MLSQSHFVLDFKKYFILTYMWCEKALASAPTRYTVSYSGTQEREYSTGTVCSSLKLKHWASTINHDPQGAAVLPGECEPAEPDKTV